MFNNQEQIYKDLMEIVNPFSSTKVISLSGKSGVGKTFVIEALIDTLKNNYSSPICYIKGEELFKNRDFYCINQALSQLTSSYEKSKAVKDMVIKSTDNIPYISTLIVQLLSNKLHKKELTQRQRANFLTEEELDIIYRFNYIFDKRSALIICDDFQYLDKKSLELIYLMLSSKEDVFDFFRNCQFLLIYTKTNEILEPIINNILNEKCQKKFEILPIQYENMDSVLHKFGCDVILDEEIKKILFHLSDGHLEILRQVALQLITSRTSIGVNTNVNDADSFFENLITNKLIQLGASGEQISTLLEYASLIGKTFSNVELSMSLDLNKQDFCNAIKKSNEMALITSKEKYSNFSHNIIQVLFRKRANRNLIFYYEKMKECVKILNPSDYAHRIDIERNLGNFREAAILIVHFCAKHDYNIDFRDSSYNQILSLYPEIQNFLHEMHIAYNEYLKKNYSEALLTLNVIDNFLPIQLLAEKDVLKSITLTKLLNDECRQEAVSCLENYTLENLNNEGDLYLRIQLSLISSYTHIGEIEKAKECEKVISNYLVSKMDYDKNAQTLINILRRKANSIHECLYAEKYIEKSVEYFAPIHNQNAPLNPLQYLMSLGNHAGILIECGRFSDSYNESIKARRLVNDNENIVFPRTHIIDNNYLLALYLSNNSLKEEVLETYEGLIHISKYADNIFILSNYCALLAVNGFFDKAKDILEEQEKNEHNNKEQLYEICVDNNLLVLKLFYKEYEQAQIILNRLVSNIDGIIDESYYRKKYELFQRVINERMNISAEKIDTFLFDLCEHYQEAWAYWGRSFDYTALYYWSDM